MLDNSVTGLKKSVSQLQIKLDNTKKEVDKAAVRLTQKENELNESIQHSNQITEEKKELETKLSNTETQLKDTQAQLKAEEVMHQSLKDRCAEFDALQNLYEQTLTENVSLKQRIALKTKEEKEPILAEQKEVEKELPVTITAPEPIQPEEVSPKSLSADLENVIQSLSHLLSSTQDSQSSLYESAISKSTLILLQHQLNLIHSHVRPLPPVPDKAVHNCMNCGNAFTFFRRRQ